MVIGGGLTSAHIISMALQQGASHVTWVMRKHLQVGPCRECQLDSKDQYLSGYELLNPQKKSKGGILIVHYIFC